MKKKIPKNLIKECSALFALLLFAMFSVNSAYAQCTSTSLYPSSAVNPTSVWSDVNSCNYAGEYALVNVVSGALVEFSTCSANGSTITYDSQLTLRDNVGGYIAYSDDYCGVQSYLSWTATYTGVVQIHLGLFFCSSNTVCSNIRMKQTIPPPNAPASPIQAAGTPTCALGSTLTVAGSAPANETWYWQTTSTGTSQLNAVTGPLPIFANGTYYVNAYSTASSLWSTTSSVVVTNFSTASAPPSAVAAVNPSCAPAGTTISVASAPVGSVYYWQGTNVGGTSNLLNASSTYPVTVTGTYYVSTYETASQCWSNTVGVLVTVNTVIPGSAIVTQNSVNACAGDMSVLVNASVPIELSNQTCTTGASASGPDDSFPTATITNFSCASGTITGASLAADMSYFGFPGYCGFGYFSFDLVVNGVTVATNLCDQTAYDLTAYLPLTSVVLIVHDDDFFSDDVVLTSLVTLSYLAPSMPQPTYSLTWYNAASGGTTLGTGSPFETVGTSVMPLTVLGSYDFYVGANLGACSSLSRELVTVNIANVNATLTPVDATCNGGNNGSFTLGTVECGALPFTYSVNGGAYGAIPTNLTAGTYSVVIMDNTGLMGSTISIVVTQPGAPTALAASNVLYFTADLSWTASGNETQWNVEYGPTGFTPGTGTSSVENATNLSLSGLTAETCYDVYVSAVCGVTSATTMINFCTNTGFFTFDNACGPGFMDISGTGVGTDLGDDNQIGFTLPWTLNYQGTSVTDMSIDNNGGISFNNLTNGVPFTNGTMAFAATGLYPLWDDLYSNGGSVYTEIIGTAPNRQAIIQWNVDHISFDGDDFVFQVVIEEATNEIYYLYDNVVLGNVAYDYGVNATIGAAGPFDSQVSFNNATYLQNNSCVHFYNALCPNPVNIVSQVFSDEVILTWSAGMYGETDWTVIYGPTGFDPATSGTTITTSLPNADILGLSQLTTYDFYIYSECMLDNLTSGGLLVTIQTLPLCSNPTGINTATAVDSLFTSWSWVETSPAYPSTGFNLQYGSFGFDLWTGTVVNADNDFTDTTFNAAFLAGGVYEVYVQAVCGTDTSNYMGPFTFVMPLSNDSVCGAEMLQVDGTVYVFDNTGATIQPGEGGIIPTGTFPLGYNGTDLPVMSWGSSVADASNWYTFVAPPTGNMRFSGVDENFFASQIAIYELTDCSDFATFTLVAASDQTDAAIANKIAPNFTICGLTPGATYYVLHDAWANFGPGITGQYSIKMTPIVLQAGSVNSMADVCTGDTTNLFTTITGYDANGVWSAILPSANTQVFDSSFVSSGLAYQIFDFEYRMTDGCAYDTIISQVEIYPPSQAGIDGALTVCKNEPTDLFTALSGIIDLSGQWYDPSNNPVSGLVTASSIPGMFNYDYIAGNGVCPNDTSNVLVTVNPACDYLDIQEMYFGEMSLSPNPTNGLVYISNSGSSEVFNYEVTDVDGRVIATKLAAINGTTTTEVNLTGKVTGMYMIRVYNDNAMKVFRVILQ